MNIGDKVRFLNDVGGGKITAFRPGGIVVVEDADGFEVPIPQNEVVVIEEKSHSLNGKEYLQSKTVVSSEEEPCAAPEKEVDEQLEARVVRLEMTIQKLEARIARLEAENNLRKNERLMTRQAKSKSKSQPDPPTTLGDLQIL